MTSLADQIIEHGPFESGSLMLASFASELLQAGPLNQLRDELIEGRKLRAAAEAREQYDVFGFGEPGEFGYGAVALKCLRCPWQHETDTTVDTLTLAELVRRADEHSEECGR